jgi:acyl-CoA thioester hydrolase
MTQHSTPTELAGQQAIVELPIQWGDQDAFGHVNGVVYFRWFETARVAYLRQGGLGEMMSGHGVGPILAAIKCDYRRQLKYPDTVLVSASIASIGRTSMQMRHVLYSRQQQAIAAAGESTVVLFDYSTQRPTPIPDDLRALIEQLEGRPLAAPAKLATK